MEKSATHLIDVRVMVGGGLETRRSEGEEGKLKILFLHQPFLRFVQSLIDY
jgi:hypothetical protein